MGEAHGTSRADGRRRARFYSLQMIEDREIRLACEAVRRGLCTEDQVRSAIGELDASGRSGGVLDLLVARGILNGADARDMESGRAGADAVDPFGGLPADLPDDGFETPTAVAKCSQCGSSLESPAPGDLAARVVFGQAFCLKCIESARASSKAAQAMFDRSSNRTRASSSSRRAKAAPAEAADGIAELARKFAAVGSESPPKPPPPLPRRISVARDLPRDEAREIERLLDKGKQEAALEHVRKIAGCTEEEARRALESFALERPAQGDRGGIFGFARALGQSTRFYMNITFRKWEKVIEDGESFLASDSGNIYLLTILGEAYAETGKCDRAEELLLQVLEADERSARALSLLGDMYMRLSRFEDAKRAFESLLAQTPGDVQVLKKIKDCCIATGDLKRAAECLAALAAADPAGAFEYGIAKADLLYRMRRFRSAMAELSGLLEADSPPYDRSLQMALRLLDARPGSPKALHTAARIRAKRKEWKEALTLYEEYVEKKPDSQMAVRKCAVISEKAGLLGKAVWYYHLVLEHSPSSADVRWKLAKLLAKAGNIMDSAEHLSALRAMAPGDEAAAEACAESLLALGRIREASEALAGLPPDSLPALRARCLNAGADFGIAKAVSDLAGPSPDPAVLFSLAEAFKARGLADLAARLYMDSAKARGAEAAPAARRLVEILPSLSDRKAVILFLDSAPGLLPSPSDAVDILASHVRSAQPDAELNRLLLKRQVESGRLADALEFAARLLPFASIYAEDLLIAIEGLSRAGMTDPRLHLFQGVIRREEGEHLKASKHLLDYLALAPGDAGAIQILLDACRKTRNHAELAVWIDRLSALEPLPPMLLLEAAEAQVLAGNLDGARACVAKAIAADSFNVHADDLMRKVDGMISDAKIAETSAEIARDPGNAQARFALGGLYLERGDFENSARSFSSCKSDPGLACQAGEKLFECNMRMGRKKAALKCLEDLRIENGIDASTEDGRAHLYKMADLLLNLGMPRKAGKLLFDIMKVDPGFRDIKDKMSLVEILEELEESGRGRTKEWFVEEDGESQGPLSLSEIKEMVDGGLLSDHHLVWRGDFSNWKRAGQADKIKLLFNLAGVESTEEDGPGKDAPQGA